MAKSQAEALHGDTGAERIAVSQGQGNHVSMAIDGVEMGRAALRPRFGLQRKRFVLSDRALNFGGEAVCIFIGKQPAHRDLHFFGIAQQLETIAPGQTQRFEPGESPFRARGEGAPVQIL